MKKMREKKMNNKGFSLVELIIVVAIMVVLVGVIAPQYVKYVQDARISADASNADAIATAVNVAIAEGTLAATSTTADIEAADLASGGAYEGDISNLSAFPTSKVNASYAWKVFFNENGVSQITLNAVEIYPNATIYESAH